MSERDLLEGLNDSLSMDELLSVPENQGIIEQDARLARLRGEPGSQERSIQAPDDGDLMGPRTPLKAFRQNYLNELERNPATYQKLLALTQAEVGNQGPEAQQAFIESVFNRAASRKQSLNDAMQLVDRGGYYPGLGDINKVSPITRDTYDDLIKQVGTGSNVGNYATGNASGTVGFNKGPQVAAYGGERFGIEGPDESTMRGIAGGEIDPTATAAFTVPDRTTGRRQMANGEGPQGILQMLGMGGQPAGQQPQGGLLGMLGDPETMSYLAMMLKGASPYSNLDPNAMLSNAHTIAMRKAALQQQAAEQSIDNRRADEALKLRRDEYGLQREDRQARDAALFEERQQKRDLATKQKEVDDEVRRNLGGGGRMPGEAAPEGAATTVPEGTRSPEDQIAQLNAELAKNPSAPIAKSIERRIEQLQKGPPAATLRSIEKAENEIAPLQATKDKLEKMQTLLPNTLEGPLAGIAGSIGGRAGYFGSQQAKDTLEFNNLAEIETIRDMSRTMKGSTAVKEMDVWLRRAADPTLPKQIRQDNLRMATDAVNRELAIRTDRIKQLQEGTYGRKQTPKTEAPSEGGGGGELPDGWTVRVK